MLAKRAEGRAPATIETIEKRIGHFTAVSAVGALDEITADQIRAWLVALKQGRRGRPTSDVYVEGHRKELAAFFTWCVQEGHLRRSPMENVARYRVTRPAIRTLTRDEIATLIANEPETVSGVRNRAILSFLYDTGVRVGELVRIRTEDVDIPEGIARITGKNRRVQTVPLSPTLRSVLWTYVERARPRELFSGTSAFFVERDGRPLTTNAVRQWMRRAKMKAGIDPAKRVSPHVIRASAATHFAGNGASAFSVQRFLRHRTATMSQRYVDLAQIDIERVHAQASPLERLARGA